VVEVKHVISEKTPEALHDAFQTISNAIGHILVLSVLLQTQGNLLEKNIQVLAHKLVTKQ
jgi:hypothetical protein